MGITIPRRVLDEAQNVIPLDEFVKAPVYKEGEWWVFRVKREGKAPEEFRVTYRNGKFESDHPEFLEGSDDPDSETLGPLVSVHLIDPEKRWLDFPLVRGKKWRFRYRHGADLKSRGGYIPNWHYADAEVIGLVPQPVKTPAGKFNAIEIRRTDTAEARRDFTYFYSPETKSVVRLKIKTDSVYGKQNVRLDLVKYGRAAPVVKGLGFKQSRR